MNKVWFYCEGEVVPSGVFDAVVALRGVPGGGSQCRWPVGDPHQPGFTFCDGDADSPSSYCKLHRGINLRPKP